MKLLLLAGTAEARDLATALAARGTDALASLAGATERPDALALPTRIGGFGGAEGFRAYVTETGITHVLDATHPFAARITDRTALLSRDMGLGHAILSRPGWTPTEADRWTWIAAHEDAERHVPQGATVFLATGRQGLGRFAGLARGRRILCRQIDPPRGAFPFERGQFVIGRPPFSVGDEIALFRRLGVDWLVVKDAGGAASRPKLDAARQLGRPVLVLRRPPLPDATILRTVAEALNWVDRA